MYGTTKNISYAEAKATLITRFMGPTWRPSGADRTQVGPMLAPWTLLSGYFQTIYFEGQPGLLRYQPHRHRQHRRLSSGQPQVPSAAKSHDNHDNFNVWYTVRLFVRLARNPLCTYINWKSLNNYIHIYHFAAIRWNVWWWLDAINTIIS